MSKDVNWADECIQKAQKTHPTSESVANRVKELLTGRLSERPLRSSELGRHYKSSDRGHNASLNVHDSQKNMRFKAIGLSWFRGAADPISLDLGCKSIVVYGENGSGKSSFVDAVEYVLRGGKIGHLSHEYSGKHQEKGVINTHTPKDSKIELRVEFKTGSELKTEIKRNGTFTSSGGETAQMNTWEYQRTILRQDELANFISDTKGDKYSVLLPLLGLHQMEIAAENLRQLAKSVEQQAKLKELRVSLAEISKKRESSFGSASGEQILQRIKALHTKYCDDSEESKDPLSLCKEIEATLNARIKSFTSEQKQHLILQDIAGSDLKENVKAVRSAGLDLADEVEPLISEKLEVLESAGSFVDRLEDDEQITCPACGQRISAEDFRAHVTREKKRLQETIEVFEELKEARGTLCDTIKSLKSNLRKADVKSWRDDMVKFAENFTYLDGLKVEAFRISCSEDELKKAEDNLLPVIKAASWAAKKGPVAVRRALLGQRDYRDVHCSVRRQKDKQVSEERRRFDLFFKRSRTRCSG